VRQKFAKHFQNRNLEAIRAENHGHIEPKDLHHKKVKIPDRLNEQI
jgi:hypothetical protein